MTQEQKEKLLLKDLCSRLPYGVKVNTFKGKGHVCDINLTIFGTEIGVNVNPTVRDTFSISDVKPYLFPLSSMTEEQYYEMECCSSEDCIEHFDILRLIKEHTEFSKWPLYEYRVIDFFHKNHFDYRGLIEKGLAIDATGLNIY